MKFLTDSHRIRFNDLMFRYEDKISLWDFERISLFYILTCNDDLYSKLDHIYDFEDNCIKTEVLESNTVDLCSSSRALLYSAFNLFNNYKNEENNYSMMEIFRRLDDTNFKLLMNAIAIRFQQAV